MSITNVSRCFSMSPDVLFEHRLQVDNGLFVVFSAMEGQNFWSKLEEKHRNLFVEGFDIVGSGDVIPILPTPIQSCLHK